MLAARSLESTVGRTAGQSKDGLLEGILNRAAKSECQTVLLAEVMIKLYIERSIVFPELRVLLVIVAQASRSHMRHERKNLQGDGIEHSGGNHVRTSSRIRAGSI